MRLIHKDGTVQNVSGDEYESMKDHYTDGGWKVDKTAVDLPDDRPVTFPVPERQPSVTVPLATGTDPESEPAPKATKRAKKDAD